MPEEKAVLAALKTFADGVTAKMTSSTLGEPDYAVHAAKVLAGYVELKAPGVGASPKRFTGHNRDQWKRFSAIPNLIDCDGNDWGLYRQRQIS